MYISTIDFPNENVSANAKNCKAILIATLGFRVLDLCLEIMHWKDCRRL